MPEHLSSEPKLPHHPAESSPSLFVPLAYFPRLLQATPELRLQYEMSGNGTGLHWDALDEDISVEGLLIGIGDRTLGHLLAA